METSPQLGIENTSANKKIRSWYWWMMVVVVFVVCVVWQQFIIIFIIVCPGIFALYSWVYMWRGLPLANGNNERRYLQRTMVSFLAVPMYFWIALLLKYIDSHIDFLERNPALGSAPLYVLVWGGWFFYLLNVMYFFRNISRYRRSVNFYTSDRPKRYLLNSVFVAFFVQLLMYFVGNLYFFISGNF